MKHFDIEINDQIITNSDVAAIIDFYDTMSIARLQLSGIHAFVTGVDSPFLNVVIDSRRYITDSSDLIKTFNSFFEQYNVPYGWFVTPATENDLTDQGFSLIEQAPAMYFDLSDPLPSTKIPSLDIQALNSTDDLKAWIQPINEGFGAKQDDDSYRKLNAEIFNKGNSKLKHFVAYHNNIIVAAGTLFLSKESVMLHNLATKTAFTKRGFGTALTLHIMEQAKRLGYRHCFLDSSEDGFNLYKKIGFKIYSTTLIYSKVLKNS